VAAQSEEIIVDSHTIPGQELTPDRRELLLDGSAGSFIAGIQLRA
jgi:hypothetical protein